MQKVNPDWVEVQTRTFIAWVNTHLKKRNQSIKDAKKGFETGERLAELVEELTGNKLPMKIVKNPTFKIQKIQNNNIAIDFVGKQGIKLVGISAEDMVDGNVRSILGLLWTLILRFQINKQPMDKAKPKKKKALKPKVKTVDAQKVTAQENTTKFAEKDVRTPSKPFGTKAKATAVQVKIQEDKKDDETVPVVQEVKKEIVEEKEIEKDLSKEKQAPVKQQPIQREQNIPQKQETLHEIDEEEEEEEEESGDPATQLLNWARRQVKPLGIKIDDFTSSWCSGEALNALVCSLKEGIINFDSLDRSDPLKLNENAINIAEEHLMIPRLIDPEDVTSKPEKLSMMTYISYFRDYQIDHEDDSEVQNKHEETHIVPEQVAEVQKPVEPPKPKPQLLTHCTSMAYCPDRVYLDEKSEATTNQDFQAIFTFRAYDIEADGTIPFCVSSSANPTRCMIFKREKQHDQDGWTTRFCFYAYPNRPENVADVIPFCIAVTPEEDRMLLIRNCEYFEHSSWKTLTTFWAFDGSEFSKQNILDPSKCIIEDFEKVGVSGTPIKLSLRAVNHEKSAVGRPIEKGLFNIEITNPKGEISILDFDNENNGILDVAYIPTDSGKYKFQIISKNHGQIEEPIIVDVKKNISPSKCKLSGASVEEALVDKPIILKIQTVDLQGEKLKNGGHSQDIDVSVKTPSGRTEVKATVEDNNDGTYNVTITPLETGVHLIDIKLDEEDIENSPLTVYVDTKMSAVASEIKPIEGVVMMDKPIKFTIVAKDSRGNNIVNGGEKFEIEIGNEEYKVEEVKIEDNDDGTYTVEFIPTHSGEHEIKVLHEGELVSGAPISTFVGTLPFAPLCEVSGLGVKVAHTGTLSSFQIKACDKFGKFIPKGGAKFKVVATDQEGNLVPLSVTDHSNGNYTVKYMPSIKPGKYTVSAQFNGKHIKSSPFIVKVTPTISASTCFAEGPGLEGADIPSKKGIPSIFTIHARDAASLPVYAPLDDEQIEFAKKMIDRILGYQAVGNDIAGGDDEDDENQKVSETGIQGYRPSTYYYDNISEVPDVDIDYKNPLYEVVDEERLKENQEMNPFKVIVVNEENKDTMKPMTFYSGDGEYSAIYEPTTPGLYSVSIMYSDQHIRESPFTVSVTEGIDPKKCLCYGPGLKKCYQGHTSYFTIQPRDKKDRMVRIGGEDFTVSVTDASNKISTGLIMVDDDGSGSYRIHYTPKHPGTHTLKVKYNGKSLKGFPVTVFARDIAELPDPEKCEVINFEPKISALEEHSFTVKLKDKAGRDIKSGGDDVDVVIDGDDNIETEVIDHDNGRYTIKYTPKNAGKYSVDVRVNNESIASCPRELYVTAVISGKNCKLESWSCLIRAPGVGEEDFDTLMENEGSKEIEYSVPMVTRSANEDGKFTLLYSRPDLGEKSKDQTPFSVSVKLFGRDVVGSPFIQTF